MKKHFLTLLGTIGLLTTAHATIVQLNFGDGTNAAQVLGGSTWNTLDTGLNPNVANLKNSAGIDSGIALNTLNGSRYESNSQGQGLIAGSGTANDGSTWNSTGVTSTSELDSKLFPWEVVRSFNADDPESGGNALTSIRFTSDTQLSYTFWIINSRDSTLNRTTLFNVGGTFSGTASSPYSFTGGTTITLNATAEQVGTDANGEWSIGKLAGVSSTFDSVSGKYILDFQMAASTNTIDGIVNGVILEAIPEPSTYAILVGLAALGLVVYQRRRTATAR